jgi:PTH1 family peptidyl-tRNA hydrolase
MKLFIGLGNPGEKYKKTRHNAGFSALDFFVRIAEKQNNFFLIGREKNSEYEAVECEYLYSNEKGKVICVWPQLYMNHSGEVARQIVRAYGKKLHLSEDIVVIHDDIDISVGLFKADKNSSSGGHKGVQNIIDQLGTKDIIRFRIGIKPVRTDQYATEDFVLKKFSKEEGITLEGVYKTVSDALMCFLEFGLSKTQNVYNRK